MNRFWHLIIFLAVAILYPILVFSIKFLIIDENKKIKKEVKQYANIIFLKYVPIVWAFDYCYLVYFYNDLFAEYFAGLIFIAIIFAVISYLFINDMIKEPYDKFGFGLDFVIIIGLSAYLIFRIPNEKMQTIVLAVFSAIIGGLITLIGVAWTIKKSDKDRKREEIFKNKPYFIIEPLKICDFKEPEGYICKEDSRPFFKKCYIYAKIKNSNNSMFKLNRIYCDKEFNSFSANNVVIPGCELIFQFTINSEKNIFLEVLDSLENSYLYEIEILKYYMEEGFDYKVDDISVFTIKSIREISKQEMDKLIKDSSKNSKS